MGTDPIGISVEADPTRERRADAAKNAGRSVFPTYGKANSGLTILALAFRLSGHLRVLMKARGT